MDPSVLENMGQFCFEDLGKDVSVRKGPTAPPGPVALEPFSFWLQLSKGAWEWKP